MIECPQHHEFANRVQAIEEMVAATHATATSTQQTVHELRHAIGLNGVGGPLHEDANTIIGALWILRKQWRDVQIIAVVVLITIMATAAWISMHEATQVTAVAKEVNDIREAITSGKVLIAP